MAWRLLLIVPTLDSYLLLPRLVESLREQSFKDWRALFIDGPSGEEHRTALAEICAADSRFSWQPQDRPDAGIFGAMNQGFAAAGPEDWILFWGSDDWAPEADVFARAVASLSPDCDLLVCRGRYVRSTVDPSSLGRATVFRWRGSYRRSLFFGSTPPHQATLIGPGSRACLARYAPGFRLAADLDYFLRLSRFSALRVQVLDLELVHMAEGGVSGREHRRRLAEVRHAYRRTFSWNWLLPFLMRYVQRVLSVLDPRR